VRTVAALRPAPDALLVSGDLSDRGSPEDYTQARELLAGAGVPVHVLGGNHDDRAALRAAFPPDGTVPAGADPYRISAQVGDIRLLGIDTNIPGSDDGTITAAELAWLEAELSADRSTPVILAMHHPPLEVGMAALDVMAPPAAERAALASLLSRASHVVRVVSGHLHRPVFGLLGGCGVVAVPSTGATIALDLDPSASALTLTREPAQVALHLVRDGEAVTHLVAVA
jgi:3',5'-cyclic-AMP phosphodiesterase